MNEHGRKCKCAACLAERRDYMPRLPGAVDPSWQAFAKIVLMNTPHLDGAKCRGHSDLFDRHPHNDPHRVIDKDIAEHMCATCPAASAISAAGWRGRRPHAGAADRLVTDRPARRQAPEGLDAKPPLS